MSKIIIDFNFPNLAEKVKAREDELMLFIAAQLQTNRALMFDTENRGRTQWAPLKLREGQVLSQKGTLRKSFAPSNDGNRPVKGPNGIVRIASDSVTIGTTLAYAPIHNTGGIIRPKRFPVLWIPLPDGKVKSSNAPSKLARGMIKGKQLETKIRNARKRYDKTGSDEDMNKLADLRMEKKQADKDAGGGGAPIVRGRNGKYYLLAKKVTIPKRPMDEWNAADQDELEQALKNKLEEILNG